MQIVRYLIPLLVFLILVTFLWKGLSEDPRTIPSPLLGKPLPEFTAESLQNPSVKITGQQFLGHVTLLNVWASWCMTCRAEHPMLINIANSKQVQLYGLNYKDQRKDAISWLKQAGNPYLVNIYDPEGKIAINLGVYGTPETFLVDQKGIIRYKYIGEITADVWQEDLLPRIEKLTN